MSTPLTRSLELRADYEREILRLRITLNAIREDILAIAPEDRTTLERETLERTTKALEEVL